MLPICSCLTRGWASAYWQRAFLSKFDKRIDLLGVEVEEDKSPNEEEADDEAEALKGPKLEYEVEETLVLRECAADEELVDMPALLPETEFRASLPNASSDVSSLNIPL